MGSRIGIDPVPPPESRRRSAGIAFRFGRVLLGLILTALRFLLAATLDIFIMAGRLVVGFRRLLFWLGLLTLASSVFDYSASHTWLVGMTAAVAGLVMMALARASLLLDDKLRLWQLHLHGWAQGWPVARYAFTVLPPRR